MKLTPRLGVSVLLAATALTGCAGADSAKDDASQAHAERLKEDAATKKQLETLEVLEKPSASVESSEDQELAAITDPEEAKAVALQNGRPEAAWDKYCVAWDIDNPEHGGTGLAQEVARTWLDTHDAECPDAIVHPHYYAQSFADGEPGEIVVTLEQAALDDYFVNPNGDKGLQQFGFLIFEAALEEHSELDSVIVMVEETARALTATPDQFERGILDAD